jgi:hypothetical protein
VPLEGEKGLGFKGIPQARHEAQQFFFAIVICAIT